MKTKYDQGAITVATTLNYTDANHPEARSEGAFDGSTDYWSGALGTGSGVFQLDLKKTFRIKSIGLAMLYGKQQSATVEYATTANPTTWISTGVTYNNATHYCLNYTNVTPFNARYIRVTVNGTGLVGLGELELYETSSTFENNAVALSANPHGVLPPGYVSTTTTPTQWGFSVQEGLGFSSSRALRLWDASSTWEAAVKWVLPVAQASAHKTLEFRCRIAALPYTPNITQFNIPILGTVSGVEGKVFWLAVFATATTNVGKVMYHNGSTWVPIGSATLPTNSNAWKLIKIAADVTTGTGTLYIDTASVGTFSLYCPPGAATNLKGFGFSSRGPGTFGEIVVLDDVNFYDPTVNGGSGVLSVAPQEEPGQLLSALLKKDDATNKLAMSLIVSPNPANNVIQMNVENAAQGPITFFITNIFGKTIRKISSNVPAGKSSTSTTIQGLSLGVYVVTAQQNNTIAQTKLSVYE